MHVREFQAEDFRTVVSLFQRTVREVNSRDYSVAQINAWAPESPDLVAWQERLSSGLVWVCEKAGDIAGFIRAEENGYIDLLYVHPEFQRQGVASALLEKVLAWASAKSLGHVFTQASLTARPFFEHFSFRVVRRQRVKRRGVEFENFDMERRL